MGLPEKKCDDIFSRFDTVHEDDGQTHKHWTTLICIASRGKKLKHLNS